MTAKKPMILPEEIAPAHAASCQQCELHQHGGRVIWGEGNPAAPVFVILDNPGAREDKDGRPYLCPTRETLQQGALDAGLDLDALYITYLLKCRPRRAYDKPLARSICLPHLWLQLKSAQPDMLFCLGNVVCQALFANPAEEVKTLRGQVHRFSDYPAVVSYHPLAARRRPALYRCLVQDFRFLIEHLSQE